MNSATAEPVANAAPEGSAWRRWGSPYLAWAFRVTLGVVFIVAALPKIEAPDQFARSIANYHLVSHGMVNAMAICLPWIELISGVAVLVGVGTRANLVILIGLLVVFCAAIGAALSRGLDISCGCFSVGPKARSMTQLTLFLDIIWIGMGVFALLYDKGKLSIGCLLVGKRSSGGAGVLLWAAVAALMTFSGGAAARLPKPIPWARLDGAKDLLQSERETAAAVLRSFRGYAGCSTPIASCLAAKPRVPAAWRLARYVVFVAGKGLEEKEIGAVLAMRKDSVLPAKTHKIPLTGVPRLGEANAPVVIVEYADFRCHHCATVGPQLKALLKRWPKKIAIYFKPYALGPGPSVVAVRAALAAHRQKRFWELQELLFANPDKHTEAGVVELAKKAKLDAAAFAAAMKDKALLQRIDMLKVEGLRLGIKGTPTLFVNGKLNRMPKDARHLQERIADELDLIAVTKKR